MDCWYGRREMYFVLCLVMHDSVIHKNRLHTTSDNQPRLARLKISEINLLAEMVGTAASPNFEVEFCGFSDGKVEYRLYPKS